MNKEQVYKEVANRLKVEETGLKEETRFKEDLQADSLDLMELIVDIEDEYGFSIADDKLSTIKTIGDLVEVAATL